MKNIFWLSLSVSVLSFTGITVFYKYKDETEKKEKRASSDEHFYKALKMYTKDLYRAKSEDQSNTLLRFCQETRAEMYKDGYSMGEIGIINDRAIADAIIEYDQAIYESQSKRDQ